MDMEASARQALIDFARAFGQGDLDAMNRMFVHDDGLLFYGTHDKLHFTSWADLEDSFSKQFKFLSDLKCAITSDIHVRLSAGGAVACAATSGFSVRGMMGDVPIDQPAVRLTCTMERSGDRWQFIQMHLSVSDRPFVESVKHVIATYFK